MVASPLDLEIRRVVTDSDLDGVVTAAISGDGGVTQKLCLGIPGSSVPAF